MFEFPATLDSPLRSPHVWLSFIPGRILFDRDGESVGIGSWQEVDAWATSERRVSDNPDYMPPYVERGLFRNIKKFYTRSMGGIVLPNSFSVGQECPLIGFIECITSCCEDSDGSIVLAHPDFDVQNFMVSPEGALLDTIDWDDVSAWPKCLGDRK